MVAHATHARAAGALRRGAHPEDRDPVAPARLRLCRLYRARLGPGGAARVIDAASRPRLAAKARLRYDRQNERYLLLYPERGLALNGTAADVVRLCTGEHTVDGHRRRSSPGSTPTQPREVVEREVLTFLATLADRGLVQGRAMNGAPPLHADRGADLPLPAALSLLLEPGRLRAARRGARHRDLAPGVPGGRGARRGPGQPDRRRAAAARRPRAAGRGARARSTSTRTSSPAASRCARERLARLRELGLDNVQLSIQDVTPAGVRSHRRATLVRPEARGGGLGEGARPAAHPERRAAPRQPRPRGGAHRPRGVDWARIASSSPTPSTSAGRSSTGARSCPRREQLERAREARAGRAAAAAGPDGGAVRARPTTTPSSRRRAWTAGRAASS